jgi:uncharacterized membrane protein
MERKHIEKGIDVKVPLRTAYNQWTQFESFPAFMEGVESVKQLDAKRLHWKAKVGGKTVEWDAEIVEQEPDSRIAWNSTSGAANSGAVSFRRLAEEMTRINLRIEYTPAGAVETLGDALGVLSRRVAGDLERFKEFIEKRGTETGAWRGEIHGGETTPSSELRIQ